MTKDYSENKIHKIYNYLGDKIYIGSTDYEFVSQRMAKHRDSFINIGRKTMRNI